MKIRVSGIVWRSYEFEHVNCLMHLLQTPGVEWLDFGGDALVERARGKAATAFLESDADVLLTIDSDIVFRRADALKICEQALTQDIVCGLYATRADAPRSKPTSWFYRNQSIEFGADPTPVEIRWAASGFMAVHRRVFEKLAKRPDMPLLHPRRKELAFHPFYLPFIVDDDEGDPILLSEDFALCERARQEGFGVWVNPAVRLGHIGPKVYRLEDALVREPPMQPLRISNVDNKTWGIESLAKTVKSIDDVLASGKISRLGASS